MKQRVLIEIGTGISLIGNIMNSLNWKSSLLIVSSFLFISQPVFSAVYTLPQGVPDPMKTWAPADYQGDIINPILGIAPTWAEVQADGLPAYYIDNTAANATDSDNEFGSPTIPRKTIKEITYEKGSYVEIHGGPYTDNNAIFITANGTPDQPVWIRGASAQEMPLMQADVLIKGQYVILENLKFTEADKTLQLRVHNDSNLHHAVVRNSLFLGDGQASGNGSALSMYGSAMDNRFHDIVIFNNEIANFGNDFDDVDPADGVSEENDYHGVLPGPYVDRVWILNNHIHHLGGDSVQVGVASIPDEKRPSHIYIAGNEFHDNLENGIDIKEADYIYITENKIYNWRQHKDNGSTGVAVVIHNGATNTWVVNNTISDAASAVTVTGGSMETWIIGNTIKNIRHPSWDLEWSPENVYASGNAIHFRGGSSGGAINNTLFEYDKGIEAVNGCIHFVNNILSHRNIEAAYDINIGSSELANQISNNLFDNPDFASNLKNAECYDCLETSAGLLVEDADWFKTADNSPGIDQGYGIEYLQNLFWARFGEPLTKDITGGARSVGSIDIGAYENPTLSVVTP